MADSCLQSEVDKETGFDFNPPNVIGLRIPIETMIRSSENRPQSTISAKSGSSTGSNNNSTRDTCVSVIPGHQNSQKVDIEYIYTDTGCTPSGHSSRLSKSSLFDDFGRLTFSRKSLSTVPWSKFYPSYPLNYVRVKNDATPYRVIKSKLIEHNIGRHVHQKNENNFNAFDPK